MAIDNRVLAFIQSAEGYYVAVSEIYVPTGAFIFAFPRQKTLPPTLMIKAINHKLEVDVELVQIKDHFYKAEVPEIDTTFYFCVENPQNLIAKTPHGNVPLSELLPVHEETFEYACKYKKFFFVGD